MTLKNKILAGAIAATVALPATAALADNIPYNYNVDFELMVDSRGTTSSNGKFCNTFGTDSVEAPQFESGVDISLWDPDFFDEQVGRTVDFGADGVDRQFCWTGFIPDKTHFFRYEKNNNGFNITGSGTVSN